MSSKRAFVIGTILVCITMIVKFDLLLPTYQRCDNATIIKGRWFPHKKINNVTAMCQDNRIVKVYGHARISKFRLEQKLNINCKTIIFFTTCYIYKEL
jgi:hypothetical protein